MSAFTDQVQKRIDRLERMEPVFNDLLAALEELVTFIETWPSLHEGGDYLHGGALLQARAAIAKAREVKP